MALHVVFTGPAANPDGTPVVREDLKKAAEAKGFKMQGSVTPRTVYLVASRLDTVKALKAKEAGVTIMSYDTFISKYLDGYVAPTGATANPIIDTNLPSPGIAFGDEL